MRIGLNLLFLGPQFGGLETYIQNLIQHLARLDRDNSYVLFLDKNNGNRFSDLPSNFRSVASPVPAALRAARLVWEQVLLPIQVRKYCIDVLHSPNTVAPLFVGCPSVVTIHDMLYKYYPNSIPRSSLWYRTLAIPLSAKRCNQILTNSHFSKRDIVRFLKIPESKVTVTHFACDERLQYRGEFPSIGDVREKYDLQGPYILSIAGTEPHKNVRGLLQAFAKLVEQDIFTDLLLALVGRRARNVDSVEKLISQLGLRSRVRTLGYVPIEEIPALYAGASVFATASLFEGFGLPVLEAMANGVPVVSSNAGSLPEVVGDAGILVDPGDHSEMAKAMNCILTDETFRRDLVAKGYQRVQQFSWKVTAQDTLRVYESAVRGRPRNPDAGQRK
jgi:glycosyltransferase involved in cell wall biosynthesis